MSEDMMQIESVQKVRGEGIGVRLPLVGRVVPAGDPCDGDDWVDEWVDLNEFMVGNVFDAGAGGFDADGGDPGSGLFGGGSGAGGAGSRCGGG